MIWLTGIVKPQPKWKKNCSLDASSSYLFWHEQQGAEMINLPEHLCLTPVFSLACDEKSREQDIILVLFIGDGDIDVNF